LITYWPIYPNDTKDYVTRADAYSCVNATFVSDRFGNPQSAFYLNNGYCLVPPGVYFTGSDFTITVWIKPIKCTSYARIIDFSNGFTINAVYLPLATSLTLYPFLRIFNNGQSGKIASSSALNLNQWTHIAALFSLQQMTLSIYLNGTLEGSSSTSVVPLNVTRSQNFIGRSSNHNGGDGDTNAYFDDLKIYARVLSQDEILEDMNF
jgi:hypothetical protein